MTGSVLLLAVLAVPVLALLPQRGLIAAQRAARPRGARRARHLAPGHRPDPAAGALLVANHVSWLDVVVILAHAPARLLAKREVRAWPLIGRLAATLGTVFVDRSRPKTLPATVGRIRAELAAGGVVAVFPEGTTWCGRMGGTFRPAMFQAAVDAARAGRAGPADVRAGRDADDGRRVHRRRDAAHLAAAGRGRPRACRSS